MENNGRNKELPEINADYIDQLLSLQPSKKEPVKPAASPSPHERAPLQSTPVDKNTSSQETVPPAKPDLRPRKRLFYTLAAVFVMVALCLILPDLIADLRSGYWQTQAAEAYDMLMLDKIPLNIEIYTCYENGTTKTESTLTRWQYGNDYLTISAKEDKTSYHLRYDNQSFSKTVTPDRPDAIWQHNDIFIPETSTQAAFSDYNFSLSSIHATLFRVTVTFTKSSSDVLQTVRFRFDPFGKIQRIDTTWEAGDRIRQDNLTVLSTNPEKIKAAIRKAYEEATQ